MTLIARREDVSHEIGLVKKRGGLKIRDIPREKKVVGKMTALAKSLNANKDITKEISRLLIADSVNVQKGVRREGLEGKKAVVVGGSGKMGEWMCRFLSNRGAEVKVWDPRGRLKGYSNVRLLDQAINSSDIIIVASPLGLCPDDLRRVVSARPSGLIFDICSIKSHIAGILRLGAADGLKVTSVHPMFGPSAPSAKGMNVVICDCGSKRATDEAKEMFGFAGARITRLYLEEHDQMMAYILGLSHVTGLLFGTTLASSGMSFAQLQSVQGPSFARLAALAKDISGESRRVYHDIQALNPRTKEMLDIMESSLGKIKDAAIEKEHDEFIQLMHSVKEYTEG